MKRNSQDPRRGSKDVKESYWFYAGVPVCLLIILGCLGILVERMGWADGWMFLGLAFPVWAVFVGLGVAARRFRIADEQLDISNEQLKTGNKQWELAARKEDLDRYTQAAKLLLGNTGIEQKMGVHGLCAIIDNSQEREDWFLTEAKDALIIYLDMVWRRRMNNNGIFEDLEIKDRVLKSRARDTAIFTLGQSNKNGEEILDLSYLDLSDANLRRAHLSRADLSGADLSEADLSEADLSRAKFCKMDPPPVCRKATFSNTDFTKAVFTKANLSGADFTGAKGLDMLRSFQGIWAYRWAVPTELPEKLMAEVRRNLIDVPGGRLGLLRVL